MTSEFESEIDQIRADFARRAMSVQRREIEGRLKEGQDQGAKPSAPAAPEQPAAGNSEKA